MELRLCIELASAQEADREWREHLQHGGAFVAGAIADAGSSATLVLIDPDRRELALAVRVVFVADHGVGVQLDDFDPALRARMQAWIAAVADGLDGPTVRNAPPLPTVRFSAAPAPAASPIDLPFTPDDAPTDDDLDGATVHGPDGDGDDSDAAADDDPIARNVHERLRNLPVAAQLKVATHGELAERIALERLYGKLVWDALLRNPRITPPEVARIARMGQLPRPLLEQIANTAAWVRAPEVRRALLANLRLSADMVVRVLRLLPKHELRLVPQQTAYPAGVRDAARRLIKESERT